MPPSVDLPRPIAAVRVLAAHGGKPPQAPPAGPGGAGGEAALRALEAERAALATLRRALEQAVARVRALAEETRAEIEAHLPDLAVAVAEKVVCQAIETDRVRLEPLVREALSRVPDPGPVVVHLNPADLALLEKSARATSETGGETEAPSALRYVADPALGRGECRVETAEGTVEARLQERFARVRSALAGAGAEEAPNQNRPSAP